MKEDPSAQNSWGLSLFEKQNYELALERFSKAIDLDETKATYYNNKVIFITILM